MQMISQWSEAMLSAVDAESVYDACHRFVQQGGRIVLALPGLAESASGVALFRQTLFRSEYVPGAVDHEVWTVDIVSQGSSHVRLGLSSQAIEPTVTGQVLALVIRYVWTTQYPRRWKRSQLVGPEQRRQLNLLAAIEGWLLVQDDGVSRALHACLGEFWYELGLCWDRARAYEQAKACYVRQRQYDQPGWARLYAGLRLARLMCNDKQDAEVVRLCERLSAEPYRDFGAFCLLGLVKSKSLERLRIYDQAHREAVNSRRRAWASYSPLLIRRSLKRLAGFYLRRQPWKLPALAFHTVVRTFLSPLFRERLSQFMRLGRQRGKPLRLASFQPPRREDIQAIAVVRLDRLGDLVCSLPAMEMIRRHYPKARISAYVTAGLEFIARQSGACDEVIGVNWSDKHAFAEACRQFRSRPFDLLIDLLDVERSWTIAFTENVPAKYKLGFDTRCRRWQFNLRVPINLYRMHLSDQVIRLLRSLGIRPLRDTMLPRVALTPKQAAQAEGLIGPADGRTIVGIHCGSGYRFRYWPAQRFAELADRLASQHHARIVLLAGKDERRVAEDIAARMTAPAERPQTSSLTQLAALMKRLDLLVCMDTGPMHLAGALGTPMTVIWGPGSLDIFRPRWPASRIVCHLAECNGCPQEGSPRRCSLGYRRDETPCMSTITVEEVYAAAEEMLAGNIVMRRQPAAELTL